MSIYDFVVKDRFNDDVDMSSYKGKVLLIINSATKCGFTKQYEAFQELYLKYKDRGLEILDFPCNQFLHQAPGSIDEIIDFCTLEYKVSFRVFNKIKVNGKEAEPLFTYLKNNTTEKKAKSIKWNFTKFLVSSDGEVIKRYEPAVKPETIQIDIEELLSSV